MIFRRGSAGMVGGACCAWTAARQHVHAVRCVLVGDKSQLGQLWVGTKLSSLGPSPGKGGVLNSYENNSPPPQSAKFTTNMFSTGAP